MAYLVLIRKLLHSKIIFFLIIYWVMYIVKTVSWKLQDGRLALGTGQGIVIVDPEHVSVKDTPMQVTFTDLKLNGISVIPGDKDSPLEASLAYAESVRLNYDQNSFVIEFSTFNYSDAGLSKFAYKLEGYDDTWSAPSSLNFAAYKNLPPGSYHLHVKARNTAVHGRMSLY